MREIIGSFSSFARPIAGLAAVVCLLMPGLARAQDKSGEEIFKANCSACHTIGGGQRVGPDLKGVSDRHPDEWIIKFVQSSQTVVKSGDEKAVALFDKFKVVMPDQALTADQIKSIIAYTKGAPAPEPELPVGPATPEQIQLGQDLFTGKVRFANGGPSCNSCHDVTNDAIISGGVLALPLTTVFTKLGGQGVRAVLGSPPFPVMQRAFENRPLLPNETTALVGFLEKTNAGHKDHMPKDTAFKLLGGGVAGAFFLLGFYTVAWSRRKRGSVNQAIFDRQIKSS